MEISDLLKEKGLKKTPQRVAILSILQSENLPMSEAAIKEKMGESFDRITFYRTIQTLLKSEVIHKIVLDNTLSQYALNASHTEKHIHFFCEKCHKIMCMYDTPQFIYQLPKGFQQIECNVIVRGICENCSKR